MAYLGTGCRVITIHAGSLTSDLGVQQQALDIGNLRTFEKNYIK